MHKVIIQPWGSWHDSFVCVLQETLHWHQVLFRSWPSFCTDTEGRVKVKEDLPINELFCKGNKVC